MYLAKSAKSARSLSQRQEKLVFALAAVVFFAGRTFFKHTPDIVNFQKAETVSVYFWKRRILKPLGDEKKQQRGCVDTVMIL